MITYCKLVGYKRLLLSGVREFEWNVQEGITSIMGRNGCGKSSLLKELNMCPADKKAFALDGYKEVRYLDDNGTNWTAISVLSKQPIYKFYKEDEQINDSSLITEQRELVKKHLGYDEYIHGVLTNNYFTKMNKEERRKLLGMLSQLDFSYIQKILPVIKTQHRDRVGILKHLDSKIITMTDTIENLKLSIPEDIEEQLSKTYKDVEGLLKYRKYNLQGKDVLGRKLTNTLDNLNRKIGGFRADFNIHVPNSSIKDINSLGRYTERLRAILESESAQIKSLAQDIVDIDRVVEQFEVNGFDKDQIVSDLAIIDEELKQFKGANVRYSNHSSLITDAEYIWNQVSELINATTLDKSVSETFDDARRIKEARESTLTTLQRLGNLERELVHQLDHLAKSDHLECPKCKFKFINRIGDSTKSAVELSEELARLRTVKSEEEATLVKQDTILESAREISANRRHLNSLTDGNRTLKEAGYWDTIGMSVDEMLGNSPKTYLGHSKFIGLVSRDQVLHNLTEKRNSLVKALEDIERYGFPKQRQTEAHERMDKLMDSNSKITSELKHVSTINHLVSRTQNFLQECEDLVTEYGSLMREFCDTLISDDAEAELKRLHSKAGALEHSTAELNAQRGRVDEANSDKESIQKDEVSLKILLKHLSLSEGIPAEQLSHFITELLTDVNELIATVWGYPFTIQMCRHAEDGVLDCVFPVSVNGEMSDDISELSSGQADMVNFVFSLMVRKYLGLTSIPLFLDEVIIHFDKEHQNAFMRLIEHLVDSGQAKQITLITHFSSIHNYISNYDAVVIDPENIVLPSHYNQNVTITRG